MHRRIKCCLFQLAEASERYGGTMGQYALLKLCDVLHVLAMLVAPDEYYHSTFQYDRHLLVEPGMPGEGGVFEGREYWDTLG